METIEPTSARAIAQISQPRHPKLSPLIIHPSSRCTASTFPHPPPILPSRLRILYGRVTFTRANFCSRLYLVYPLEEQLHARGKWQGVGGSTVSLPVRRCNAVKHPVQPPSRVSPCSFPFVGVCAGWYIWTWLHHVIRARRAQRASHQPHPRVLCKIRRDEIVRPFIEESGKSNLGWLELALFSNLGPPFVPEFGDDCGR